MAYEQVDWQWVFKSEAIKLGDRFYLAKINQAFELIPQWNPLTQKQITMA